MTFVILYTSNVSFLVKLDENLYHVIFAYVAYNLKIKTLKTKTYFPSLLHVYRYSSLSLSPPPSLDLQNKLSHLRNATSIIFL